LGLNGNLEASAVEGVHQLSELQQCRIAPREHHELWSGAESTQTGDDVVGGQALGLADGARFDRVHRVTPATPVVAAAESHEVGGASSVGSFALDGGAKQLDDWKIWLISLERSAGDRDRSAQRTSGADAVGRTRFSHR
jgi:hypothetical protein